MAKTRAEINKDYKLRKIKESGDKDYWKKYGKKWRKEHPMPIQQKENKRKYNLERYKNKKDEINYKRCRKNMNKKRLLEERKKSRDYYDNNPSAALACIYRDRILTALHRQNVNKTFNSLDIVGCSWSDLKLYIEKCFLLGMNWNNHGRGYNKWHIDHIIPCSYFDLSKIDEVKKCFHFTNLRPLWEKDNLEKNNKLPQEFIDGKLVWSENGWKCI